MNNSQNHSASSYLSCSTSEPALANAHGKQFTQGSRPLAWPSPGCFSYLVSETAVETPLFWFLFWSSVFQIKKKTSEDLWIRSFHSYHFGTFLSHSFIFQDVDKHVCTCIYVHSQIVTCTGIFLSGHLKINNKHHALLSPQCFTAYFLRINICIIQPQKITSKHNNGTILL